MKAAKLKDKPHSSTFAWKQIKAQLAIDFKSDPLEKLIAQSLVRDSKNNILISKPRMQDLVARNYDLINLTQTVDESQFSIACDNVFAAIDRLVAEKKAA